MIARPFGLAASAALVACGIATAACDRTALQPELRTDVVPGRYVRTVGGFVLSEATLQQIYDSLTRDVARALQYPEVRAMVYTRLHASPYPEHKVHFRTFLQGDGRGLLEAIAQRRHVLPQVVLATLDSLVDFEFYMPVKEHWRAWDGGGTLLVADDLSDDDPVLPKAFDLAGDAVAIESWRSKR